MESITLYGEERIGNRLRGTGMQVIKENNLTYRVGMMKVTRGAGIRSEFSGAWGVRTEMRLR